MSPLEVLKEAREADRKEAAQVTRAVHLYHEMLVASLSSPAIADFLRKHSNAGSGI